MGALAGMQQGLGKTRIGTWKTVQGTRKPSVTSMGVHGSALPSGEPAAESK